MIRIGLVVVAAGTLAWLAFVGARLWQGQSAQYPRPAGLVGCPLEQGACRQRIDGGWVELHFTPAHLPLMETLSVRVLLHGLDATGIVVDVRGLNMDMGLNRTRLVQSKQGEWRGETILPVCSQRRMEWEAAVLVDGQRPMSIPFLFSTTRP